MKRWLWSIEASVYCLKPAKRKGKIGKFIVLIELNELDGIPFLIEGLIQNGWQKGRQESDEGDDEKNVQMKTKFRLWKWL